MYRAVMARFDGRCGPDPTIGPSIVPSWPDSLVCLDRWADPPSRVRPGDAVKLPSNQEVGLFPLISASSWAFPVLVGGPRKHVRYLPFGA